VTKRLPEVIAAAESTLELCGVKPEDRVALWTDTARKDLLAEGFFTAADLMGAKPLLLLGTETADRLLASPPTRALEVFRRSSLVIDVATQPWLYTKANAETLAAGVPILQVLVSEDDLVRLTPRREIAAEAKAYASALAGSKEIRITSPRGTDLTIRCGKRTFAYQAGFVEPPDHLYDSVGVSAVTFYPEAGSVNGTAVVDGPISLFPECFIPGEPVRFEVVDGRATEVSGGTDARRVASWLASWDDPNAYLFAHTGFGLDSRATLSPLSAVDAEAFRGGVNIAFGSSMFPQGGGDVVAKSHLDAILLDATFSVDGDVFIAEGYIVHGDREEA
jgi:2,5-dihydroxypyridine 5,6-dioxygenase